jgi:hypothetical protein
MIFCALTSHELNEVAERAVDEPGQGQALLPVAVPRPEELERTSIPIRDLPLEDV